MNCGGISAKTYSGCYGGEKTNIGDSIIVEMKCPIYQASLMQKQIIFVVDESGSMANTIPGLKASLFAARNTILRLILSQDVDSLTETDKDTIFTEESHTCIITFSDIATCRWESEAARKSQNSQEINNISFSTAVNEIKSYSYTNMGDALLMAFQKCLPDYATWIILLTDGVSNKGLYQTVDGFKTLMTNIPVHTKIIPLGYTTEFDPSILSALGTMTYLDSQECIAEVFGGIMAEIVTCYGIDAEITLPSLELQIIDSDTLITAPIGIARDIIGTPYIGCLFSEREYMYGHLPWGNNQSSALLQYHGLIGTVSYYDIVSKIVITSSFVIEAGVDTPDNVYEGYFESSKARIILGIYQTKASNNFDMHYINNIRCKLDDWKHPAAGVHKEEILRILSTIGTGGNKRKDYLSSFSLVSSTQNQTHYHGGRYSTPSQRLASTSAGNDYRANCTIPDPIPQSAVTINSELIDSLSRNEHSIQELFAIVNHNEQEISSLNDNVQELPLITADTPQSARSDERNRWIVNARSMLATTMDDSVEFDSDQNKHLTE